MRLVSSATSTSLMRELAAESDSEKAWMLAMALVNRLPLAPRVARESETF